MFGFSGRKDDKTKPKKKGSSNLAQFGLMEVPDIDNLQVNDYGDDDGDEDLEAELLALTGGGGGRRGGGRRPPKNVVSPEDLQKMVNECMRDDIADDISDEEDPELLAELNMISCQDDDEMSPVRSSPAAPAPPSPVSDYRNPVPRAPRQAPMAGGGNLASLLSERVTMYEEAEANAKSMGETSRARRFNRGLKTLRQMQKDMKAGKCINESDIPPEVLVKKSAHSGDSSSTPSSTPSSAAMSPATASPVEEQAPPPVPPHNRTPSASSLAHENSGNDPRQPAPPPSRAAPPPPRPTPQPQPQHMPSDPASIIRTRHAQYRQAALTAKKGGDKESAIMNMKIMKQLEPMLAAAESGQPVDLATLPGPPGSFALQAPSHAKNQPEPAAAVINTEEGPSAAKQPRPSLPNAQGESQGNVPGPAATQDDPEGDPSSGPTTVLEALEQRMAVYVQQRDKAKNDGNARKERMMDRIVKQYQGAIRTHKKGSPIPVDELPTPPGFPPIPVGNEKPAPAAPPAPAPQPARAPAPQPAAAPAAPSTTTSPTAPTNVRKAPKSRVEKQLSFLTKRQAQFREAALEAKKRGEIEQAKEYLRMYKGFDQLIETTQGGLPVDINTVPVPPQEQASQGADLDFELVCADDCIQPPATVSGDVAVTYARLEEDLISQIKMCAQTREHFKATGDVASSNRFEQLILHTKKDLDAVRAACKRGNTLPRFHYENRSFTIVQCNTDLNDSDFEISVVRGVNFNVQNPTDVDTYVKIEFPYPADTPPQDRSYVVKDTNNPEYNHKVVFSIDRKSRALLRVFKRQNVKIQVWAKGGWFHRDTMIGQVKIPLADLQTKCTLHDSFDLMDERKKMVGGKLEVKLRARNPIVAKQLDKITERWLVIDGF